MAPPSVATAHNLRRRLAKMKGPDSPVPTNSGDEDARMKIYGDTDTLRNNIATEPDEQEAVEILFTAHDHGIVVLYRSNINHREVMNTPDPVQRQRLVDDAEQRERVPNNERLHGFQAQDMGRLGFISSPLMSDVQDDALCQELERRGLARADAQHITQAVCNACDVFLTRDRKTIIKPHRAWLESRFPGLKIRLPSELVTELRQAGVL
jgi:hypothetical protein